MIRSNFSLVCFFLTLILFSTAFVSAQVSVSTPTPATTKKPDAETMLAEILDAIERDDKTTIIKNLSAGFPAEFADRDGNTLLMQAAKKGKTNARFCQITKKSAVCTDFNGSRSKIKRNKGMKGM